jgi:hypothetical protein
MIENNIGDELRAITKKAKKAKAQKERRQREEIQMCTYTKQCFLHKEMLFIMKKKNQMKTF